MYSLRKDQKWTTCLPKRAGSKLVERGRILCCFFFLFNTCHSFIFPFVDSLPKWLSQRVLSPVEAKGSETRAGSPTCTAGPEVLEPSPAASRVHKQGAGLEMKYLGLKPTPPLWGVDIWSDDFTCWAKLPYAFFTFEYEKATYHSYFSLLLFILNNSIF